MDKERLSKINPGRFFGILPGITKKEIAEMLRTTPEAIRLFEKAYADNVLANGDLNHNAKTAAAENDFDPAAIQGNLKEIIERITDELLAKTEVLSYNGQGLVHKTFATQYEKPVVPKDLADIPPEIRPQLTGNYLCRDCDGNTANTLLYFYKRWRTATTESEKELSYNMFRQGLDILDLDEITWRILGMNRNAMGHWFPGLVHAVQNQDFFKVPTTAIAKIPVTLLQLTRMQYEALTPASRQIANEFCMRAFDLDVNRDYFIKTGTFSSKFDFRNAKVTGESEVRTLGEYLLFIQNQAVLMAGSLSGRPTYGASTTNEWVVREFIQDVDDNPCIYMGMPLRTEYRVFVDFDADDVIVIVPDWHPDVMKDRFSNYADADNPHIQHDWIIYTRHEDVLMSRYKANKEAVAANLKTMLRDFGLTGQWSVDVMQNGDEFYIIDMALAANSALAQFLPPNSIRPVQEDWLPKLN